MSSFIILFSIASIFQPLIAQITITTQLGYITGESINGGDIYTFKGIPYVENQPVGEYRFTQSQLKTSPYTTSPFDATSFGPICPPFSASYPLSQPVSESCLLINVWTNSINTSSNLPVLVFIHGGGFTGSEGASSVPNGYSNPPYIYDNNNPIVFVSFDYRLGGLGFLPLKEIKIETNGVTNGGLNGINDQIIALKWVKQYISDFGGNPNQVTIWGISAGKNYSLSPPSTQKTKNNDTQNTKRCSVNLSVTNLTESKWFV